MRPAIIHFVGAGPGDPELLTIKGAKLLKKAAVVVYAGSLVSKEILRYCSKKAAFYDSASMHLKELTDIMIDAANSGKSVVRLHTGDTSLYSAFGEQAEIIERNGIPYDITPGVSSAFAAAASLKKEFTVPEVTQTVIFTRLAGRTPVPAEEDLEALARHKATICVFLSARAVEEVARLLMKGGYPPSTPAAVVYKASWDDEINITGTLKDIARKAKKAGIKRHALILAGKALGVKETLAASKLYDREFSHGYRTKR
jgi:precorrin-4/cobalt-precorrin-4 C11-methyltransferase